MPESTRSEPTMSGSLMTEQPISDASACDVAATPPRKRAGTTHKVFAAAAGLTIGYFSGGLTGSGFNVAGNPALLLFAVIILYFAVFRRYLGGTLFQRLLRAY